MRWGERPVILVGHGLVGAKNAARVLELGVPVLTSWQAAGLLDDHHPNHFGRPGQYGQRAANKILVEADHVVSLGCRCSIWTVGYEGLKQRVTAVDVDFEEWRVRYPKAEFVCMDAGAWVAEQQPLEKRAWVNLCDSWRNPWLEWHHKHGEYLHSHACIHRIGQVLKPDAVVVTEMGAAICGAFQVLRLKPPQKLMTSGGLGEMGCGLPYAVGASFARDKGEVILLATDGGMMLNLAEWATVAHHKLPVKCFLFDNRGYAMIRHTQTNLHYDYHGVTDADITLPNFRYLMQAWGIPAADVRTEDEFERVLAQMMAEKGPCVAVIHIDPAQRFWPKLEPIVEGGKVRSPRFDELTPQP